MLTRKQHELLIFIDKHLRATGFSPSFEEMKDALKLKSKSGIHRLITALEERGFLRRRAHRARALEVIRLPENMASKRGGRGRPRGTAARDAPFAPNVIHGRFAPTSPGPAAPPTRRRRCSCRCMAGSPPACRSRRCATAAAASRCRPRCWPAASTTRWRSPAIP